MLGCLRLLQDPHRMASKEEQNLEVQQMLDNASASFPLSILGQLLYFLSFNMVRSFKDSPIDYVLWLQIYSWSLSAFQSFNEKALCKFCFSYPLSGEKASSMQSSEYWKPQPSFLYSSVCLRATLLVLTVDPPR